MMMSSEEYQRLELAVDTFCKMMVTSTEVSYATRIELIDRFTKQVLEKIHFKSAQEALISIAVTMALENQRLEQEID